MRHALVALAVAVLGCSSPVNSPPVTTYAYDNPPRCGAELYSAQPFPVGRVPSLQCSTDPFWSSCEGVPGRTNGVIVAARANASGGADPVDILNCGNCGLACPQGMHCANVAYRIQARAFAAWTCHTGPDATLDAGDPRTDAARPPECPVTENVVGAALLPDGGCAYRCTATATAGFATCSPSEICTTPVTTIERCGECDARCNPTDRCVFGADRRSPQFGSVWHCERPDAGS